MVVFAVGAIALATLAVAIGTRPPESVSAGPQATIHISPEKAANAAGTSRTLTAHVDIHTSAGVANASAGTNITFTILSGPGSLSESSCFTVLSSGSCSVTLTSAGAGVTTIRGSTTLTLDGRSLSRSTGDGLSGDGDDALIMWSGTVPFSTIAKGFTSYYRYDDGTFSGGCVAIRESPDWGEFWTAHTIGYYPPPPLPAVDFVRDMVLACILGFEPYCCASEITIETVTGDGINYEVSVNRTSEDGMLPAVTNPYHLVRVPMTAGSVVFTDESTGEPIPEIPAHP